MSLTPTQNKSTRPVYEELPAILFLIFNRPDLTQVVFNEIRKAKPKRLYIGCDGPRPMHPQDDSLCERTRRIATAVDWPCKVYTLFQDYNIGCGKAVSTAITWFFEHEEFGIILEDDCLPHPEFFYYCALLLDYYYDKVDIGIISGNAFESDFTDHTSSYRFSNYAHIWGWATWRRTWNGFNIDFFKSDELVIRKAIKNIFKKRNIINYWQSILDNLLKGQVDSWGYPFFFWQLIQGNIHIIPHKNLVSNIGFSSSATHTSSENHPLAHLPTFPILPLKHPEFFLVDDYLEQKHFSNVFDFNPPLKVVLIRFFLRMTPNVIKKGIKYIFLYYKSTQK